jgi:hypothetical protein
MSAMCRLFVIACLIDLVAGERRSSFNLHGAHASLLHDRDLNVEKAGYGPYSHLKYSMEELDSARQAAVAVLKTRDQTNGPEKLIPLIGASGVAEDTLKNIVFCKQNGQTKVAMYFSELYATMLETAMEVLKPLADAPVDNSEDVADALNFEGLPNSKSECEEIMEELQQNQDAAKAIDVPPIWEDWHMLMQMYLENVIAAQKKSSAFQIQYYAHRFYKLAGFQVKIVRKWAPLDLAR